nr:transposase [Fischerella sp. PCC 9605]
MAFQAGDTKAKKSDKSVATVISARERVENTDYFDQMCSAAAQYLKDERENDEDDVNSSIATLEEEKKRHDSQIQRFLNFLDDEALSRVRLTISFRIDEDKDKSGDAYVYAAAQTLEAILGQDTPIRMQGLILENLAKQPKNCFLHTCIGEITGISFIDSTPINVCHNCRVHSHKIFKGLVKWGKNSALLACVDLNCI